MRTTTDMKYSDDTLSSLKVELDRHFNYAQDYVDIAVKGYSREAWEYFYGNLPLPVSKGSSRWVDRTVWEAVNGSLQDIINVFCSGEESVRFVADDEQDSEGADAATKLVNQILLRDNPGYNIISSSGQECLVTRNSFIKYYWDEETTTQTEDMENIDPNSLPFYLQGLVDGGLVILEEDIEENEDGSVNVSIKYEQTVAKVKVEYVPSEQIFVDQHATNFYDCQYFCQRVRKTKRELLSLGFPENEIDSFNDWSDPMDSTQATVAWSRTDWRQDVDMDIGTNIEDPAMKVWTFEHYIRTGILNDNDEVKLYQVIQAGSYILSVEEINAIPYVTFCPYPIPGSFFGQSVYDITKDIQDLRTALIRGYIDNINNANHNRYMAVEGAYDRRSLLDNRPGGVVQVQRPDAISLFPYHNLPQGIDGLLALTDELKEIRTGVTKLGMGINSDVFRNDNAFATVGLMMNAAQNRLRMVCRNIANNGMIELMKGIYNLIRENGKTPIDVQTPQGVVQIDPKQLPPRNHLEVVVAISPAEKAERAQKLISLKQIIQSDEQLAPLFTLEQDRKMTSQIFELMGIKDVHNYLMPLEQLQPQEPSPMEILNMQLLQAQVGNVNAMTQKTMADAQNQKDELNFKQQHAADEISLKSTELQFKQEKAADEMSLENRKEDNKSSLEQAKHNMYLMQQSVKEYSATLKELELNLKSEIEKIKILQSIQDRENHSKIEKQLDKIQEEIKKKPKKGSK